MNFSQFDNEELNRRFGGTTIYNKKKKTIAVIIGIYKDKIEYIPEGKGWDSTPIRETWNLSDWDLNFPILGFVPHLDCSIFLSRIPLRQFLYGFHKNNIRIKIYGNETIKKMSRYTKTPAIMKPSFKQQLFDKNLSKRYKSLEEAFTLIKENKKLSVPIDKNWCILSLINNKNPVLVNGNLNLKIGTITDSNKIEIPSEASFLYEELSNVVESEIIIL